LSVALLCGSSRRLRLPKPGAATAPRNIRVLIQADGDLLPQQIGWWCSPLVEDVLLLFRDEQSRFLVTKLSVYYDRSMQRERGHGIAGIQRRDVTVQDQCPLPFDGCFGSSKRRRAATLWAVLFGQHRSVRARLHVHVLCALWSLWAPLFHLHSHRTL